MEESTPAVAAVPPHTVQGTSHAHGLEMLHRVRILYDQLPTAQFSQVAAALLVFAILFKHQQLSTLVAWFVFVGLTILARMAIADRYQKAVLTLDTAQYWFNWFLVGTMLYGIMWSATATILVPGDSITLTSLTSLVLCALSAGAVAVSSVSYKVFLTYASSTLWPYAAFLITIRDDPQATFGWLMLVYFIVIAVVAKNVNQYFTKFIHLQIKKAELEDTVEKELNKREAAERALLDNTLSGELVERVREHLAELRRSDHTAPTDTATLLNQKAPDRIKTAFRHFVEGVTQAIVDQNRATDAIVELLKGTNLSREQQRYTSMIEKALHDSSALVQNFSDAARIEGGDMELKHDVINVRRLLIYLVEELPPIYKIKDIRIRRRIDPQVPNAIYGDAERLKQMLWHLLLNAIRSTEHGEVDLSITSKTGADNSTELLFEVIDSGSGLPPEAVQTLAGEGETELDPASGLGIVRNLAALQGGSMFAERRPGAGSRVGFTLRFPTAA